MKKVFVLFALIFSIMALTLAVGAADVAVEADDQRIFNAEGESFYLPSYVSPSSVKLVHDGTKKITYKNAEGEVASLPSGTVLDLTPFKTTVPSGQEFYMLTTYTNGSAKILVFNFANNLPSIHIETTLGRDTITANNSKDTMTKITIINKDGSYEYADSSKNSEIKVRGNATKAYAKKPFQIKLNQKTDLYGMGESRTWILLANYDDQSLIRNNIMYKIGELLGMHTCEFRNVDIYLDGQYYGVYLLCEKVSISSSRVNILELEKLNDELNSSYKQSAVKVTTGIPNTVITEYAYVDGVINPSDITGGYLIELDNNYWQGELCYFITSYGSHYVVKSPEYASKEQVEYIATLFGEMEEAIMSSNGYNRLGKHYSEYADIDSLVYAYIVAEFSRNYDAGSSSMYFYKDADKNGEYSKIVKGPLWDCDNTLGNIHKNGASSPEGYWARNRSIWAGLTKHSEFNSLVTKELAKVYDEIFDMIDVGGFVYQQVEDMGQSIFMERSRWNSDNYSKWPLYYDGVHYDRWQSAPVFNFVDGYYSYNLDKDDSTVIGYLCEHIEARLNWLAQEWGCDVELRERCFEMKDTTIKISQNAVNALAHCARVPLPMSALAKIKLDYTKELIDKGIAEVTPSQATANVSSEKESGYPTPEISLLTVELIDTGFFKEKYYV
ncbi:MAG: CotH kinase family protein [Clostridia bacterium]|nr:CotH kinase family protein [Clostridia bacterium]